MGMARKLRVKYPGAVYHVMNRGDRRKPISGARRFGGGFFATLGEACAKTGRTAVTVKWIAERWRMGAPGYVNHLLYHQRKAAGK